MKRLLAILLLSIHLLNCTGYSAVFQVLMQHSEQKMVARIDAASYNSEELTIVKAPVQIPYAVDWNEFERVDGTVEIEGVPYAYVARKLSKDTMYYQVLPNQEQTKLKQTKNELLAGLSDLPPAGKKAPDTSAKKSFFGPDYDQSVAVLQLTAPPSLCAEQHPCYATALAVSDPFIPFTPPDAV